MFRDTRHGQKAQRIKCSNHERPVFASAVVVKTIAWKRASVSCGIYQTDRQNYFEDSRLGNAQFSCDIAELLRGSRFIAAIMASALAVVGTLCGLSRLLPKTRFTSHVNAAAR